MSSRVIREFEPEPPPRTSPPWVMGELESDVAERIARRAKQLGGDGNRIAVMWEGSSLLLPWRASVALLPPRQRGRYFDGRGATPLRALIALDRVTADAAAARGQEPQS
jgi:hypothetical protein